MERDTRQAGEGCAGSLPEGGEVFTPSLAVAMAELPAAAPFAVLLFAWIALERGAGWPEAALFGLVGPVVLFGLHWLVYRTKGLPAFRFAPEGVTVTLRGEDQTFGWQGLARVDRVRRKGFSYWRLATRDGGVRLFLDAGLTADQGRRVAALFAAVPPSATTTIHTDELRRGWPCLFV